MAPPRIDLKKTYQAVNPAVFGTASPTFRLPTDYTLPGPEWSVLGRKKSVRAKRPQVNIPEFINMTPTYTPVQPPELKLMNIGVRPNGEIVMPRPSAGVQFQRALQERIRTYNLMV